MTLRIGFRVTLGLLLAAGAARAQTQTQPWRGSPPGPRPPARPRQPVAPRYPTLQRRPPAPQQPPAPFRLTPQEEAYLDRVLQAWEQRSKGVKTFACNFTRWEYDPVFGDAAKPRYIDQGRLKYAAPDRGMFRVMQTQKNGKMVSIEPERAEHWICDGKSVFEYNYQKKQLIQHKLPPELRGKAIEDGPLPFLFGAEAAKLKQRYFLRVITPRDVQGQVWLAAYPRLQQDAANFKRAELILTIQGMTPFALRTYSPNGKNRTVYQFQDIVVNDPWRHLKFDPFIAITPPFWTKIVKEPPAPQIGRQPGAGRRR